jgi:hypothetical protein
MFLARQANLTAICGLIAKEMWDRIHLKTLEASAACL